MEDAAKPIMLASGKANMDRSNVLCVSLDVGSNDLCDDLTLNDSV
jgi:hypothetical protein